MRRSANSGSVSFQSGEIVYREEESIWRLPISSICLVGEYTNQYGPFSDDYFLVFLTRVSHAWYQVPFYAEGLNSLMAVLRESLGDSLKTGLANSVDFKSRVMWPPALLDRPLFEFTPSKGILGRIGLSVDQRLHPDVLAWVGGNGI
jgi:hypothetical protein